MIICIATPSRDFKKAHPEYIRARDHLLKNGLAMPKQQYQIRFVPVEGLSLLPMARSLLASACLAFGADYIFMVDDDIFFRSEDIRAAILSDLPIVGFPCLLREEESPDNGPKTHTLNYSVFPDEPQIMPDKDWRQIAAIGTGAILIKREVFIAMQRHRPWFRSDMWVDTFKEAGYDVDPHTYDYFPTGVRELRGSPRYVGEDYGFCHEAQTAGYPIYLYGSSVTCHFHGSHGVLCDYASVRDLARKGVVQEGVAVCL